jgi:hypothetical protein
LDDRIDLYVIGGEQVLQAVEEHRETLVQNTLATGVRTEGDVPEMSDTFRANEFEITVGF